MKRITTAAIAATLSLSIVTAPANAAEDGEKMGSSEAYQKCTDNFGKAFEDAEKAKKKAKTEEEKAAIDEGMANALGEQASSTPSGVCIKFMTDEKSKYRSNMLGLLIGVPVALVALLGAAGAAYAGMIPGVSIPGAPAMPDMPKLPM